MTYRLARSFIVAVVVALAFAGHDPQIIAQSGPLACGTDMRVLVVSADGNEADLPAIRAALDYLGTPYDVYIAVQNPGGLTDDRLASGCRARYQGVILTTGDLGYFPPGGGYASALTPAEFDVLATYERTFRIRQVTWYTFPTPDYGLNYPTAGTGAAIAAQVTNAGAPVFPYIRRGTGSSPIPIEHAWTYLTTVAIPGDPATIPILTDAAGHALAVIHTTPDGRENLAMTFDSNANLVHAWLLSYGVVNWLTSGLFIGERHAYISPQVDDLLIDNTQWLASTPCGTNPDETGSIIRMTGADYTAIANWQATKRRATTTAGLRLTMAFNGEGSTGIYNPDTLLPAVTAGQNAFFWVNHTFTHANLDAISYADATTEITMNNAFGQPIFSRFSLLNLVQPDVSGLNNPEFLRAAFDAGIRYLISDASRPEWTNPSPNTGRWSAHQPAIFVIPRRANNLFFSVAAPADWVGQYNCIYASFWGRDLTIAEILDVESQNLLAYMLRGDLDPWMFHQANLVAYDGTHSLLSDLLDRAFTKYNRYVTLPVTSVSMDTVGTRMLNRTKLRNSGISASIQPGVGVVLTAPVNMTVPITGLRVGTSNESYGGEWISFVTLKANETVTYPLTSTTVPGEAPIVNAGAAQTALQGAGVTLTGTASDQNTPPRPLTYAWTQTSGPAVTLSNPNTLTVTFTVPTLGPAVTAPAVFGFALTADNGLVSSTATTTVTVAPTAPPAGALAVRQVVFSDGPSRRDASGITASAGDVLVAFAASGGPASGGQTLTVVGGTGLTWRLVQRTNAQLGTAEIWTATAPVTLNAATVSATQSFPGDHMSLTVVTFVNASGVGAFAGASAPTGAQSVTLVTTGPGSLVFGVGNDWDDDIARTVPADQALVHQYLSPVDDAMWVQSVLRWVEAAGTSVTLNNPAPTADKWNYGAVEILAGTSTTPPGEAAAVNAGAAQTVLSGAAVTLTGTAIDQNTPPRPLTYAWTQTSGPAVTLSNPNTLTATFTAPTLGPAATAPAVLGFALTVDNGLVSSTATTTVTVAPTAPPAGALAVRQVVSSDGHSRRDASGITASAGDVLVAFAASGGPASGGQTLTVAGGTGLTWRLVQRTNAQLGTAEIWTATATAALSDATVSATQSLSGYHQSLTVVTFANASGVGAFAGASAPTGAPSVTLVTTGLGSLVFGAGNDWDDDMARTVPADQALVHQYLSPVDDTMWVQSVLRAVEAAGTPVTLNNPAPTTDRWNYGAVEILAR